MSSSLSSPSLVTKIFFISIFLSSIISVRSTYTDDLNYNYYVHYNVTNSCSSLISVIQENQPINDCLPVSAIIISLPAILNDDGDGRTKINLLSQIVKMTCEMTKCSTVVIQQAVDAIKHRCKEDLLIKNPMVIAIIELINYYEIIREIICLRDTRNEYNSFCVLETLINIGNAPSSSFSNFSLIKTTTTNLDNNDSNNNTCPSLDFSLNPNVSSLLSNLTANVVCTDCNKVIKIIFWFGRSFIHVTALFFEAFIFFFLFNNQGYGFGDDKIFKI